MDSSTDSACLNSGDVAILLDGGNKGNKARLLQPWKLGVQDAAKKKVSEADDGEAVVAEDMDDQEDVPAPGFVPTLLTLGYTEESVTQNRRRNQFQSGLARVPQSEWVHIVSDRKICLPSRKRLHYPGTTVGDLLSGLEVPAIEAEWHMPWGEKKAYYGKKLLVAVGGKTEVAPEDKEKATKTDKSMVPTVHHLMPGKFYEEMVHTFFAKCVIDLTPLSGKFAWAALKAKVAYVGIVPTAAASAALKVRLTGLLKEELATPGSKLYSTEYAEAIGGAKNQKDCDKDKKDAKAVPKKNQRRQRRRMRRHRYQRRRLKRIRRRRRKRTRRMPSTMVKAPTLRIPKSGTLWPTTLLQSEGCIWLLRPMHMPAELFRLLPSSAVLAGATWLLRPSHGVAAGF